MMLPGNAFLQIMTICQSSGTYLTLWSAQRHKQQDLRLSYIAETAGWEMGPIVEMIQDQELGHVVQLVTRLAQESVIPCLIPGPAIYFCFSFSWFKKGSYVHLVLVNCLGGLSLFRICVVRLTDRPDIIIAVYRGREATK